MFAIAKIPEGNIISGSIVFTQDPSRGVKVVIQLRSDIFRNTTHGIHIHEKKITEALLQQENCCDSLGGHFNPDGYVHGYHAGDLCHNITFNKHGVCFFTYYDNKISLRPRTTHCIVGRSIIIHEDPDDCGSWLQYFPNMSKIKESLTTGNSGRRLVCANVVRP